MEYTVICMRVITSIEVPAKVLKSYQPRSSTSNKESRPISTKLTRAAFNLPQYALLNQAKMNEGQPLKCPLESLQSEKP
jgi:hypothetical protein